MKITLEIVRQTLRDALGFDSFTAGFISKVEKDQNLPTAAITKDGLLTYNPEFIAKNVNCIQDLFCLLTHEMLHRMFNHFIHDSGLVENIAADAVINAVISNLYATQSNCGYLFRKLYKSKGIEGLLRPLSRMRNSRFDATYDRLYTNRSCHNGMTTGELITTLRVLLPTDKAQEILLLGSHGSKIEHEDPWPSETLERMANDFKRSILSQMGSHAGYSATLVDMFMEALRSHISIKRQILQRLTTNRKVDKFKELCHTRRITCSPVPVYPSKRDLILLASGFYPGFFHNQINQPSSRNKGLSLFIDVSGSVETYLPKILGILRNLRREITTVYLFSNKVFEVAFSALLKGQVKTTGGTDFDCVAESIIENRIDKAVIITDGYASMSLSNQSKLGKQGIVTLTILFHRVHSCELLEKFGDVVHLEEITQ